MKQKLDNLVKSRSVIKLCTRHPDGTVFYGIVLGNTTLFVVLQELTSFEADGIVVIPKKWITAIHNGKNERCMNEVVQNILSTNGISISNPCEGLKSLRELVGHLQKEDIWPAVEVLYEGKESLYLGPITKVSRRSFSMNCFDAAGEWEKEYELGYNEIFKIEIESRYVKHFSEYMKRKNGLPRGE